MKIEYDPNSDALYVRLNEKSILESEQIRPGIVLDYDAEGNILGIEVLGANKFETAPLKNRLERPTGGNYGPTGPN